jgi:hypothetical protein
MKPSLHFTLDGLVRALRMRAHGIATDLDLSRGLMTRRREDRHEPAPEDARQARRSARRDHDRRRD